MAETLGIVISTCCLLMVGLTYGFYPLVRRIRLKPNSSTPTLSQTPKVSILFAAYNEISVIQEKIESIFKTTYPIDQLEVWVGSDLSDDGTDEVIKSLQETHPNLHLFRTKERTGKSGIMNVLAEQARGEVLIATDANIIFEETTIPHLIRHFSSTRIGAVAGRLAYKGVIKNGTASSESNYLNIENTIRLSESQNFGFCLGMEGGLYAIRKEFWSAIPPATFMEDFFQTMQLIQRKKEIKFDPEAIGYEDVSTSLEEEFKRKKRISLGNFQNLKRFRHLLLKAPYPLGYAFLLHKILRWYTPHILLVLVLSLLVNPITALLGYITLGVLLLQLILLKLNKHGLIAYFCAMNAAMLLGHIKYLRGVRSSVWEPTKRKQE